MLEAQEYCVASLPWNGSEVRFFFPEIDFCTTGALNPTTLKFNARPVYVFKTIFAAFTLAMRLFTVCHTYIPEVGIQDRRRATQNDNPHRPKLSEGVVVPLSLRGCHDSLE